MSECSGTNADVQEEMMRRMGLVVSEFVRNFVGRPSVRAVELAVATLVNQLGALILGLVLGELCRRYAQEFIERKGITHYRFRLDDGYRARLMTVYGEVSFSWHALRIGTRKGRTVTVNPAQKALLPYYLKCRSSPLLLEWECATGSTEAFRHAQKSLRRFTHGAVTLEDTTIASHAVTMGSNLDRSWLYCPIEQIRSIVNDRATRCVLTNRPLVYVSSDAHALRRYLGDTWTADWKMINGLRVWCIDQKTGELIHLGGEYTWGDCREVARILHETMTQGYLPRDGDFKGANKALYIWLSDGMPWFNDHLLPLFDPTSLIVVLDAYHVVERIKGFANKVFSDFKRKANALHERLVTWIVGVRPTDNTATPTYPAPPKGVTRTAALRQEIGAVTLKSKAAKKARAKLLTYLASNEHRTDYATYRARGIAIGSGPMESLHRTASQARLKIPGARWTAENAQAILNLRLMKIVGRSDAFWAQPNLTDVIYAKFSG